MVGKVEREVGGRGRERGEGSGEKEDFLLLPMLLHESLAYFFFYYQYQYYQIVCFLKISIFKKLVLLDFEFEVIIDFAH